RTGAQRVHRGVPVDVPWLTYALIGLNVLAFLIGIAVDGSGSVGGGIGRMQIDYGLIAKGADRGQLVGVGAGEWYRLITSGFLHYAVLHRVLHLVVLYLLGRILEPAGRLRLALIYTASLIVGSLGALVLSPGSLTVGASGAVFGLMGAVFMGHRSMGMNWRNSPVLNIIILNLVFTFAFSRMISVGGHVGGLIGGGLAGWLVFDLGRRADLPRWLGPVLTVVLAVGAGVVATQFADAWL